MDEQNSDKEFSYDPGDGENAAFDPPEDQQQTDRHPDRDRTVSWTASEFIARHKSAQWYLVYFGGLAALLGIIFLITGDYISTVSIGLVGLVFAYLANHKPKQLAYQITNQGISVGSKFYPFVHFKSFALAEDGAIGYVNLIPLKRFMPELSVYFPPDQREQILQIIGDHLPHDHKDEPQIDKIARKLHF